MSRYVRDDKQFRAQIAKLADVGLSLAQPGSPLHFDEPGPKCVTVPVDTIDMSKLVGESRANLEKHFSKKDYPSVEEVFQSEPCGLGPRTPVNVAGVPAYVRVLGPDKDRERADPAVRRKHFNLPGLVAGLIMGTVIGAVIGIVIGVATIFLGGAH